MIGRVVGAVLGGAIGRENGKHGVAGALIGAGTLFAARRLLPQRYAVIGATLAAGYLTRKWAERGEARKRAAEASAAAHAADPALVDAAVADPYAAVTPPPANP